MCNPVVIMLSRRGCFTIPCVSLWTGVLPYSPTAVSDCSCAALGAWRGRRAEAGQCCASLQDDSFWRIDVPTLFAVSRAIEAVSPLGWTLPSAFQLSGFLVEGQKWALGWLCSSCSSLSFGNVTEGPKPKQIPNLWAFPALWPLVVQWEGSQLLVSLCHLLEVGAGLGASLAGITFMTDIFQFKKKNKGCVICRTRHWENSVCDQWPVQLLRQRKLFPLVLSWDSKISQR